MHDSNSSSITTIITIDAITSNRYFAMLIQLFLSFTIIIINEIALTITP
jgi:hypothetical protein